MEERTSKNKLIYITALYINVGLIVLSCLLLFIQTIRIYSGEQNNPYNPEIVKKYILQILPLLLIMVLSIIFIGVYSVIINIKEKEKIILTYEQKFKTLTKNKIPDEQSQIKERRIRLIYTLINITLCIVSLVFFIFYIFNHSNFISSADPTNQVLDMFIHLSPFLIIILISGVITMILREKSFKKSISLLTKDIEFKNKFLINKKALLAIRISFIAISIVLIVLGIVNGEHLEVLKKAANICSECIGLG